VPRPRLLKAEGERGREGLTLGGDQLVVVSSMASVMGPGRIGEPRKGRGQGRCPKCGHLLALDVRVMLWDVWVAGETLGSGEMGAVGWLGSLQGLGCGLPVHRSGQRGAAGRAAPRYRLFG
jgi:hypothetical protein